MKARFSKLFVLMIALVCLSGFAWGESPETEKIQLCNSEGCSDWEPGRPISEEAVLLLPEGWISTLSPSESAHRIFFLERQLKEYREVIQTLERIRSVEERLDKLEQRVSDWGGRAFNPGMINPEPYFPTRWPPCSPLRTLPGDAPELNCIEPHDCLTDAQIENLAISIE